MKIDPKEQLFRCIRNNLQDIDREIDGMLHQKPNLENGLIFNMLAAEKERWRWVKKYAVDLEAEENEE